MVINQDIRINAKDIPCRHRNRPAAWCLGPTGTGIADAEWAGGSAMKTSPEIAVTLSDELLRSLQAQARELNVPLKWLVAGLVCDTVETAGQSIDRGSPPPVRHVA
jgi:hypothetical protein